MLGALGVFLGCEGVVGVRDLARGVGSSGPGAIEADAGPIADDGSWKVVVSQGFERTPARIALGPHHVYFTTLRLSLSGTAKGSSLFRMPFSGGAAEFLLDLEGVVFQLVPREDAVYWVSGQDVSDGLVMRADTATFKANVVARDLASPLGLAFDDGYVLWVDFGMLKAPPDGRLMRALPDGSEVKALASDLYNPVAMVIDESAYYVSEQGRSTCKPGTRSEGGRIRKFPKDGSPPVTLIDHLDCANSLAADRDRLYWRTATQGVALTGWVTKDGLSQGVFSEGGAIGGPIATNGRWLAWSEVSIPDGRVIACKNEDCLATLRVVGSRLAGPVSLTFGGDRLYWVTTGNPPEVGGAVHSVRMP